ncbi:MAG: hypothetical protein QM703_04865 [Gemmatales bacterium]
MLHLGRLTILASFCAFTGMVLTPRVNAIAEAEIDQSAKQAFVSQIPLDKLPEQVRNKLTYVIGRAQLFEKGKSEAFPCNPEVYRWLLESPDASLFAWKKLGATKAGVTRLENGSFLGTDGHGGEMRWSLIATGPTTRIWYAEGSGRIGPLLPTMTIRAIVALHFEDVKGVDGRKGVKHRLELLAHYDSSAIVNKLTNMSAESTGKKVIQQLEVFFSGMAWYVSEHSAWSRLTMSTWATTPESKTRLQQLIGTLDQADAAIENVIPASK